VSAALVLPLAGPFTGLIRRLIAEPSRIPVAGLGRALKAELLETPELAVESARSEVVECARSLKDMFAQAREGVFRGDERSLYGAAARDESIDLSNTAVTDYLVRLPASLEDAADAQRRNAMLRISRELELVGDVITGIVVLGQKLLASGASFSVEGTAQLRAFWKRVSDGLDLLISALEDEDVVAARSVLDRDAELDEAVHRLHDAHVHRLVIGVADTRRTSDLYMDLLTAVRQVHRHLARVARDVLIAVGAR
jgi:phosphate:Na+ symporter